MLGKAGVYQRGMVNQLITSLPLFVLNKSNCMIGNNNSLGYFVLSGVNCGLHLFNF